MPMVARPPLVSPLAAAFTATRASSQTRQVATSSSVANEDTALDSIDDYDTAAVAAGQTEIGTGTYSVVITGGGANFQVQDANGDAVTISDGAGGWTSAAQAIADGVFDTGRGLTIDFDIAGTADGTGTVDYTALSQLDLGLTDASLDVTIRRCGCPDGNRPWPRHRERGHQPGRRICSSLELQRRSPDSSPRQRGSCSQPHHERQHGAGTGGSQQVRHPATDGDSHAGQRQCGSASRTLLISIIRYREKTYS